MIKILEEDLIGWKTVIQSKVVDDKTYIKCKIIKLLIPKDTMCNIIDIRDGKCRAAKAKTLEIYDLLFDNSDYKEYCRACNIPFLSGSKINCYYDNDNISLVIKEGINRNHRFYNNIMFNGVLKASKQKSITNNVKMQIPDFCGLTREINSKVIYRIGNYTYPDSFNSISIDECSNGIHFFKEKDSAIKYAFIRIIYIVIAELNNVYYK